MPQSRLLFTMASSARVLYRGRRLLWVIAAAALIVFAFGLVTGAESESYPLAALIGVIWMVFLLAFAYLFHRELPDAIPERGFIERLRWRISVAFIWVMAGAVTALGVMVLFLSSRAVGLLLS
jgi:nitrogen fixation/metabolism regulation signal transduction histidine kinase